jgi:ABC-2 type transport system ATP-binding protein
LDPAARTLVWDEVRRLNREFGTAILLTTQYLEEADELAQRIGFIDRGRVIAEGTPEELKRSLRDDTIVIELDRAVDDLDAVADVLRRTEGVARVVVEGNRLAVHTGDGARAMLAVATSLQDQRACIRALELHTPSLDDVFLRLTGRDAGRLAPDAEPDGARQEEAAEELDGFVRSR